jgi:hypothetical protein
LRFSHALLDGQSIVGMEHVTREDNKLRGEDRSAHAWYRFVLSFPPHLVRAFQREDIQKFARRLKVVLPKNLGDLI